MTTVAASFGKFIGYILVRDKDGKPKIDDPMNLPKQLFDMLTDSEKEEIYHGTYPYYDC
jgi:hypothetical protein